MPVTDIMNLSLIVDDHSHDHDHDHDHHVEKARSLHVEREDSIIWNPTAVEDRIRVISPRVYL